MKNYIVRIIRQEKDNPERIIGTVEDVETEKRTGFDSFDKLKVILIPAKGGKKVVSAKKLIK